MKDRYLGKTPPYRDNFGPLMRSRSSGGLLLAAHDILDNALPQVHDEGALVLILGLLVSKLELDAVHGDALNRGEGRTGDDVVRVGGDDGAGVEAGAEVGGVGERGVVGAVVVREEGHAGEGLRGHGDRVQRREHGCVKVGGGSLAGRG